MRISRFAFPVAILTGAIMLLAAPTTSEAARFHLAGGKVVEASYVGEADGQITVLNSKGKREQLDKASIQWVDWSHKLSPSLEKKATQKRTAFFKKRRSEAIRLIKKYGKAKPEKRPDFEKSLAGFQEHELLAAFDLGLRSKKEHVQTYSLTRLQAFESKGAIVPFVNCALVHTDTGFADRAHAIAIAKNRDATRNLYEYAMQVGEVPSRLRALQALKKIDDKRSVRQLVRELRYVHATIRAQLVRSKGLREVPVRLGQGNNVSIELPEVELIEVMTTTQIPVEGWSMIERETADTLKSITGEDFGTDPKAWANWWSRFERAEAKKAAAEKRNAEKKNAEQKNAEKKTTAS